MNSKLQCPKCGSKVPSNSKFCNQCSAQIVSIEESNPDELSDEEVEKQIKDFQQLFNKLKKYLNDYDDDDDDDSPFNFFLSYEIFRSFSIITNLMGGKVTYHENFNRNFWNMNDFWPDKLPTILESGISLTLNLKTKIRNRLGTTLNTYKKASNIQINMMYDSMEKEIETLLIDGKPRSLVEGITLNKAYQDAEIYYERLKNEDYEGAIKGFSYLKSINPYDAYFRNTLGGALYSNEQYIEALKETLVARTLDIENLDYTVNLMRYLMVLGLYPSVLDISFDFSSKYAEHKNNPIYENGLQFARIAEIVSIGIASLSHAVSTENIVSDSPVDISQIVQYQQHPWTTGGQINTDKKFEVDHDDYSEFKVFISYRRDDCEDIANWLFNQFRVEMPEMEVFIDKAELASARDFKEQICKQIDESDILIALIGNKWMSTRLNNPKDVLRREIIRAKRSQVDILPVIIDDTKMPNKEELPKQLFFLSNLHALGLDRNNLESSFHNLKDDLDSILAYRRANKMNLKTMALDDIPEDEIDEAIKDFEKYLPATSKKGEGIKTNRFPKYGNWEIVIHHPGSALRTKLIFCIEKISGSPFEGLMIIEEQGIIGKKENKFRIEGNWALILDIEKDRILGFWLSGLKNDTEEFILNIPMQKKIGNGYLGKDEDGFTFNSRNVSPNPDGF